jgi:hypothetical protein
LLKHIDMNPVNTFHNVIFSVVLYVVVVVFGHSP